MAELDVSLLYDAVGGNRRQFEKPDQDIVERLRFDDSLDVPIELTDLDMWANYVNDDLYAMDKKIREFLKKIRYTREKKGGYRTTVPIVFAWIYGRKPEPKDSGACRMLHELMRYYCTSYTGKETTHKGKKVTRAYNFSKYATENRRPYSLRLRLEEAKDGQCPWRKSNVDDSKKRLVGRRKHSEDSVDADEPSGSDSGMHEQG